MQLPKKNLLSLSLSCMIDFDASLKRILLNWKLFLFIKLPVEDLRKNRGNLERSDVHLLCFFFKYCTGSKMFLVTSLILSLRGGGWGD